MVQKMIEANERASQRRAAKRKRKRTARFEITFTVEVDLDLPPRGTIKEWHTSDLACNVALAATALVDSAPRRPFRHEGVTITDTVEFAASFLEEVESD